MDAWPTGPTLALSGLNTAWTVKNDMAANIRHVAFLRRGIRVLGLLRSDSLLYYTGLPPISWVHIRRAGNRLPFDRSGHQPHAYVMGLMH